MVRCLSVCPVDQHLPFATAGSRYPSIATGAHAVAAGSVTVESQGTRLITDTLYKTKATVIIANS